MNKRKVAILGGGISGLSLAHYLNKLYPEMELTVFEKKSKAGGVLGREITDNFIFDTGPKTFSVSRSEPLLDLIYEYGLESQIKLSSPESNKRFLYQKQKIQKIPQGVFEAMKSKLTRKALLPLIGELSKKKQIVEDESVKDFTTRRFGSYIAHTFFDPLTLGIYATSFDKLSMNVCFPKLKKWEEDYGSVIKGLFRDKPKSRSSKYSYLKGSLFSLEGGMYSLIDRMTQKLPAQFKYNQIVEKIDYRKEFEVVSNNTSYYFDQVFSALPLQTLKNLKNPLSETIHETYKDLKSVGIVAVSMEFEKSVLPVSGFGYLTQSVDKEDLLGVVFDSKIFRTFDGKDRLTVMMGGSLFPEFLQLSDQELEDKALNALQKHLSIKEVPNTVFVKKYPNAIPCFEPFHKEKIASLESLFNERLPGFHLVGNYLQNGSVSSCISTSKDKAMELIA